MSGGQGKKILGPTRRDAGQGREKRRGGEGSRELSSHSLITHTCTLGSRGRESGRSPAPVENAGTGRVVVIMDAPVWLLEATEGVEVRD